MISSVVSPSGLTNIPALNETIQSSSVSRDVDGATMLVFSLVQQELQALEGKEAQSVLQARLEMLKVLHKTIPPMSEQIRWNKLVCLSLCVVAGVILGTLKFMNLISWKTVILLIVPIAQQAMQFIQKNQQIRSRLYYFKHSIQWLRLQISAVKLGVITLDALKTIDSGPEYFSKEPIIQIYHACMAAEREIAQYADTGLIAMPVQQQAGQSNAGTEKEHESRS